MLPILMDKDIFHVITLSFIAEIKGRMGATRSGLIYTHSDVGNVGIL